MNEELTSSTQSFLIVPDTVIGFVGTEQQVALLPVGTPRQPVIYDQHNLSILNSNSDHPFN